MADFSIINAHSLFILNPLTDAAEDWMAEHLPDDALAWGHRGVVVEPRYIGPIIDGILEEGLEL